MKALCTLFMLMFFIGFSDLKAQSTDAWYDGGSLLNVDLCDHNGPADFGFDFLYWDLQNITSVFSNAGMVGPVHAIQRQLNKLESWLGEHGDGLINFDVTNQSKVDNVLFALMEIAYDIYEYGSDLDNNDMMEAAIFLYYDAEHCLNFEYWGD